MKLYGCSWEGGSSEAGGGEGEDSRDEGASSSGGSEAGGARPQLFFLQARRAGACSACWPRSLSLSPGRCAVACYGTLCRAIAQLGPAMQHSNCACAHGHSASLQTGPTWGIN